MRLTSITVITFLTVIGLSGCDSDSLDDFLPDDRELTIETKLNPVESCRTIVSKLRLFSGDILIGTVEIDIGGEATFRSVRIPPGQFAIDLRVEVLSNNETVISEGKLRQAVLDDNFQLVLAPTALMPIMEICLTDDEQSFVIKNRGIGSLRWTFAAEGLPCLSDNPSCLDLNQSADIATPEQPATITYSVNAAESGQIILTVISDAGKIRLVIVPSGSAGKHHSVTFKSHRSNGP